MQSKIFWFKFGQKARVLLMEFLPKSCSECSSLIDGIVQIGKKAWVWPLELGWKTRVWQMKSAEKLNFVWLNFELKDEELEFDWE